MNETFVIDQSVNPVSIEPLNPPVDTSTVIHETQQDQTKKTDGSSIQIHLQTTNEQTNDISVDQISATIASNDRNRFQSFVLAITALRDDQKVLFSLSRRSFNSFLNDVLEWI